MVQQHGDEHHIPDEHRIVRPGAWLPADHRIHSEWLGRQIDDAAKNRKELVPCLKEFKAFIEGDPRIYMYFNSMFVLVQCLNFYLESDTDENRFQEVPHKHPYNKDPTGHST